MAALKSSKRGIYFTLITVLIVSLLLLTFSIQNYVSIKQDIPVVKIRVTVVDDYVKNIGEIYLEKAVSVSGYRALEALALYENRTGRFLSSRTDLNDKFSEVMLQGTINGASIDTINGVRIMENNTLLYRLEQIENASRDAYNVVTNFSKNTSSFMIIVWQDDSTGPWKVAVNATTAFTVNADLATWHQKTTTTARFSTYGIHDPLYFVNSSGAVARRINQTWFTSWNITNLYEHIAAGTYKSEPDGAAFLGRFYNNLSGSPCCGIESPLNPNSMGLQDTAKSYIDYCFYTARCPPDTSGQIWNISGITSSDPLQNFYAFKLDDIHVVKYNVTAQARH